MTDKTREQELKESINKFQLSILNDIAKCSYLDGRKEGIKEERERIMKIIDEWAKETDINGSNGHKDLKQKIKSEGKND